MPKRPRSPSPSAKSSPSSSRSGSRARTRSRGRSPSPTSSPSAATPAGWASLHDGSVLSLEPLEAVAAHLAGRLKQKTAARVAAFDLDDTLVTPASGKVFAESPADWRWLHPSVPARLRELWDAGYALAVFSNQSGVARGGWNEAKATAVRTRAAAVAAAAGVPLLVYLATREDAWRKPLPGMWTLMEERLRACGGGAGNGRLATADFRCGSFYVGDAAGREELVTLAGRKKDFSCSDRRFAHNVGVAFYTPESFFLRPLPERLPAAGPPLPPAPAEPPFSWGGAGPEELRALPGSYAGLAVQRVTAAGAESATLPRAGPVFARPGTQEMVLLSGYPGCGKTTLYRRHFAPHGYAHVNQDTLKTKAKCLQAARAAWAEGRSVVVDSTNPTAADRQPFVDIARAKRADGGPAPARLLRLDHSMELAEHLNSLRGRLGLGARVPKVAYYTFRKRAEPVTPAGVRAEGLEEALVVPPVVDLDALPPQHREDFFTLT